MPSATAKVAGQTLASTTSYEVIDNNIYFPPSSLSSGFFADSGTTTYCPWKGTARYYNVVVDGRVIRDAAWYYPEPLEKAMPAKGFVAFYKSKVDVESEEKNPKNTITP